jgi:hypothetical protein
MRPARANAQTFAPPLAGDPLRRRLPRAADDERGRDQIAEALALAKGQDRICMKIHKSPPSVATLRQAAP